MKLKDFFLMGEVPWAALGICCATAFYAGWSFQKERPKFAVAERGATVLLAVLDNPGLSPDEQNKRIVVPIKSVLQKYADQGFVVLEAGRDENGAQAIIAAPSDTVDITSELKTAIQAAKTSAEAVK